jgi:hypothetical protein
MSTSPAPSRPRDARLLLDRLPARVLPIRMLADDALADDALADGVLTEGLLPLPGAAGWAAVAAARPQTVQ